MWVCDVNYLGIRIRIYKNYTVISRSYCRVLISVCVCVCVCMLFCLCFLCVFAHVHVCMNIRCEVHVCVSDGELQSDLNSVLFLRASRGFCMKAITHLHLVPMSRTVEATRPFPTCAHSLRVQREDTYVFSFIIYIFTVYTNYV